MVVLPGVTLVLPGVTVLAVVPLITVDGIPPLVCCLHARTRGGPAKNEEGGGCRIFICLTNANLRHYPLKR